MADNYRKLTWPYAAFAALTVLAMIGLHAARKTSNVHLRHVQTSVLSFRQATKDDDQPLLNEAIRSVTEVLAIGFDTTYTNGDGSSAKTIFIKAADGPTVLRRADGLYLKDLFVSPGTRVVISIENNTIVINVHPEVLECCRARVGVVKNARLKVGAVSERAFTPDRFDPFVKLACAATDCSLRISSSTADIKDFAEELHVRSLNFDRPGTAPRGERPESGITGGTVELTANDLLRQPFRVRNTTLSTGSSLSIEPEELATINLSIYNSRLEVNGDVPASKDISTYTVSDGDRVLTPTILEVMIGEPWHKSLAATVGSIAAASVSLWGLLRHKKGLRNSQADASAD